MSDAAAANAPHRPVTCRLLVVEPEVERRGVPRLLVSLIDCHVHLCLGTLPLVHEMLSTHRCQQLHQHTHTRAQTHTGIARMTNLVLAKSHIQTFTLALTHIHISFIGMTHGFIQASAIKAVPSSDSSPLVFERAPQYSVRTRTLSVGHLPAVAGASSRSSRSDE